MKVKEQVQFVRQEEPLSDLERLEQLHSNYQASVAAIKANYA
jgi:hypothetical protein